MQISNLESSIKNGFLKSNQTFSTALEQLKAELLAKIEEMSPRFIPPLDAFNRILEPEIAFQVQRNLEFLTPSKAKNIVAQLQEVSKRKDHQPFQNFSQVLDVLKIQQGGRRLISEEKMLAIIDRWNY